MPTKAELEQEVVDLRAQLAVFGVGRAPREDCKNSCPHGVAYHGGAICPGEMYINTSTPCTCPKHPDDPPLEPRTYG